MHKRGQLFGAFNMLFFIWLTLLLLLCYEEQQTDGKLLQLLLGVVQLKN